MGFLGPETHFSEEKYGSHGPRHYLFHLVNSLCVVSMMNPGGAVDSVVMNWIAIVCLNWIIFPSLLIFARDWELVRCITGKRGLRRRRVVEGILSSDFGQSVFDFLLSEILVARLRVIRVENKVLSPLSSYQAYLTRTKETWFRIAFRVWKPYFWTSVSNQWRKVNSTVCPSLLPVSI